jgi:hypothetical protein
MLEHPAEEWGRAVADLQSVRFEFGMIDEHGGRRVTVLVLGLFLMHGVCVR